jgi:hypothetical protein
LLLGEFLIVGLFYAAWKFRKTVIESFFHAIDSVDKNRHGLREFYESAKEKGSKTKNALNKLKGFTEAAVAFVGGKEVEKLEDMKKNEEKGKMVKNKEADDKIKYPKLNSLGNVSYDTEKGNNVNDDDIPYYSGMNYNTDDKGHIKAQFYKNGKLYEYTNPILSTVGKDGKVKDYVKMANGNLAEITNKSFKDRNGNLVSTITAVDPATGQPFEISSPLLDYKLDDKGNMEPYIKTKDGQEEPIHFRKEGNEYIPYTGTPDNPHNVDLPFTMVDRGKDGVGYKIRMDDGQMHDVHLERVGNDILPMVEYQGQKKVVDLPYTFKESGTMLTPVYYYTDTDGSRIDVPMEKVVKDRIYTINGTDYYHDDSDVPHVLNKEIKETKIALPHKKMNDGTLKSVDLPSGKKFVE